jgi:membrane protein
MISLLKKTLVEWHKDKAALYAASLAFYALIALAPILLIIIAVAGAFFGEQAIQGEIVGQIQNLVGKEVASSLEYIVENAHISASSALFTIISVLVFLFASTRVFAQLRHALNIVWDVEHQPKALVRHYLKSRFLSIIIVFSLGFLFILFLIISAVLSTVSVYLANVFPIQVAVFQILNSGLAFIVITLVFAMIYKFLPDMEISWNDVWIGSAATSFLFMIGNMLIGFYMRNISIESVYGAAGSVIIILFWLYYCAQIFFFGAEFTNVYAKEYGSLSGGLARFFFRKFFK